MLALYVEQRHGICEHCKNAKDKRGAACYCVQYGIIIGYPKAQSRFRASFISTNPLSAKRYSTGLKTASLCLTERQAFRLQVQKALKLQNRSKYRNRRIVVDGETFDSQREAQRWYELKLLRRAGVVTDLQRQVPFVLIPEQKINGKTVERPVKYVADFVYKRNGEMIVEDAKGVRTKEYIIKRKLMLWVRGIRVQEV